MTSAFAVQQKHAMKSPSRDGSYYIVRENDRLANILQKYKVSLDEFILENGQVNIDFLESGEELFLPGVKRIHNIDKWLMPISNSIVSVGHGWKNWPRRFFHNGLDFLGAYRPVHAVKSGVVTYSGWLGGYGNVVIVKHDDAYKTLYGHLARRHVTVGQRILQGQPLGRSGDGCNAHLHFEISNNGKSINPSKIFKRKLKQFNAVD